VVEKRADRCRHWVGAACRRAGRSGAAMVLASAAAGLVPATFAGAARPDHAPALAATERHHLPISVVHLGSPLADSQSSNWFGYNQGALETDSVFSSIGASWVVPTASQKVKGQAEDSATWIGIGGGCVDVQCDLTDPTLVQAGTEQDVAANGKVTYDAWYEVLPAPEIQSTIAVHPGDTITCAITSAVPGVWGITLTDTTDGQGFTETVPYPSDETTAEWIEETPTSIGTNGANILPLPNLTTVSFTGATANGQPAALVANQGIQLIDANGKVIGTPSLPVGGDRFDDCAWAMACAAP